MTLTTTTTIAATKALTEGIDIVSRTVVATFVDGEVHVDDPNESGVYVTTEPSDVVRTVIAADKRAAKVRERAGDQVIFATTIEWHNTPAGFVAPVIPRKRRS